MAQRDTKHTQKESAAMKEQPSSTKLKTSLSEPASSDLPNQQKSNSRRHLTLPISLNNTYPQSPAELYIACRSQILNKSNEQQNISPETPLSIVSSINSIQPSMSHAQRMDNWRQEQTKKIHKKQKHQYVYGPALSSPTSSGLQFPPALYFSPSTPLNNIQSSIPPSRIVKKG